MSARIVTWSRRVALSAGLLAGLASGCGASAFQCSDDSECGADGTCQPGVGYCSFPDDDCPSEQRYGEHAGDGLAGECVEPGGSSSTTSITTTGIGGTTGVDPDDGADSSTGIGSECEADSVCAPMPPDGWEGPFVALLGAGSAPECPDQAPRMRLEANAGLTAPEAECTCECMAPGCDVDIHAAFGGGCAEKLPISLTPGMCQELSLESVPRSTTIASPELGCTESSSSEVPSAQWTDQLRLCEGPSESCTAGTCVPNPGLGAGVCIYREGEHACPLSDYTQEYTFHRGIEDGRGCSPCSCGGDATCQVSVYDNTDCAGMPVYVEDLDMPICNTVSEIFPTGATVAGMTIEPEGGPCEAQGGEAEGSAIAVDPLTLCCRP